MIRGNAKNISAIHPMEVIMGNKFNAKEYEKAFEKRLEMLKQAFIRKYCKKKEKIK